MTTFVHRVRLKNYRSIGACDVKLGSLTFLVGPNGSGKSNFLDALRFVADALNQSLDHAIRDRGGVNEVRRRSSGHPNNFAIRLDVSTARFGGYYAFEITAPEKGAWSVKREECFVREANEVFGGAGFDVADGVVASFPARLGAAPPASADRLYLVHAAGYAPFRPLFDALTRMGFYNLNPDAMRKPQPPDPGNLLNRDGSNCASVLAQMSASPSVKERVVEYLAQITPGVAGVEHEAWAGYETVEFRQQVQGARHPWWFRAQNMSDGTLRALGILLALNQKGVGLPIPLVGIEEPENALHPAAAGVVLDALRDAATRMQVLVTSHSAELLDDRTITDDSILAVSSQENQTRIAPLDQAGRQALHERLYTAGELLRMDQLQPEEEAAMPRQLRLFGADEE